MFYVVDQDYNVANSFACYLDAEESAQRLANQHDELFRILNGRREPLNSFEPEEVGELAERLDYESDC